MAFNREAGTAALLAPQLVAEQLLACASPNMPVQRLAPDGSALPAEARLEQWDHEGLTRT
ncbi:hypothetical protein [Streptomyces sp. NPDC014733]|uniref:hypothetical protein n=1 Tax=Streptomyces sp. NPDC014733 TaxID=3364885 RepID=UPI0037008658